MIKRRISFRRVLCSFHRIIALRNFLAITAITLSLSSCYNEPEFIGGNIVPTSDILSVKIDTSFKVSAYTVRTDSIPTGLYNLAVLGCYNSDIFGKTKADFRSHILLTYLNDTVLSQISPRPEPKSLILYMKLAKTWGTNKKTINVKAYELSDTISYMTYYNGLSPVQGKYNPTPISLPTTYSGDSLLKIQFTDAFASKLINAPDTALKSNDEFVKYMKGIYITSDDYNGSDGVFYFFNGIKMELTYELLKDGVMQDTVFSYFSGTYAARYNHFIHDYSTAKSNLKINHLNDRTLNDTTFQDSLFYISGLGGARGLIKLKGFKEWAQKMPITITRAELRFDVQGHSDFPKDSIINPLQYYYYRDNDTTLFYSSTSTNDIVSLYDYTVTQVQTSRYNKPKNYYSLDVTLHLQNLIKGDIKKEYFYLEPTDFKVNYKEGIFRSGKNSKRMKLIITYTKL